MGNIVGAIVLGIAAAACFVFSYLQFNEKGFLFNNAYIYASKEERRVMDKKPYYRQSGMVFFMIGIVFAINAVDMILKTGWLLYAVTAISIVAVVYAIVSTVLIEKKKKYDFQKIKERLIQKGYGVNVCDNKESAADYINKQIDGKTVGFGGSVTIHEMNLFAALSEHNVVYWHDEKPSDMSVMETRTAASRAEIYISSVNGISEDGEIVNIDNTGNRIAAISYGPEKVFLIVGKNKIAPNLEAAIYRARNIAAPLNAKRLKRNTPCALKGDRCYDCKSPERICRNLSVLWSKPTGAEYEVILIDEELGY